MTTLNFNTKNRAYNGNPNLLKANVVKEFTAHEAEEFEKCMNDPIYFIRNYIKIVHVDRGLIPFDLYDYQERMLRIIDGNRFVIGKMARQSGKTSSITAYLLHNALFNPKVNIAILANKGDTAREILQKLQMSYEHLPNFLKQGILTWNKGSLEFENGSRIKAAPTSAASVRGSAYNIIFLDEFAFIEENIAAKFFKSTYPTISSGNTTKVIIVSTPNGMNTYYDTWQAAVEKESNFIPIDIHWSEMPGRDEAWKKETIKNTSEELFRQEFECIAGDTLIEVFDTITNTEIKIPIEELFNSI